MSGGAGGGSGTGGGGGGGPVIPSKANSKSVINTETEVSLI